MLNQREKYNFLSINSFCAYCCLFCCYIGSFIGVGYIILLFQSSLCTKYDILEIIEFNPINQITYFKEPINEYCNCSNYFNQFINQIYYYDLTKNYNNNYDKNCIISNKNYSIFYLENTNFNFTPSSKFGLKDMQNCNELKDEPYDVCFTHYKNFNNLLYVYLGVLILFIIIPAYFLIKCLKQGRIDDSRVHIQMA